MKDEWLAEEAFRLCGDSAPLEVAMDRLRSSLGMTPKRSMYENDKIYEAWLENSCRKKSTRRAKINKEGEMKEDLTTCIRSSVGITKHLLDLQDRITQNELCRSEFLAIRSQIDASIGLITWTLDQIDKKVQR